MTDRTLKSSPASQAPGTRPGAWDRIGTLLSGLCLAHCVALPSAVLVLPGLVLPGLGLLASIGHAAHPVLAVTLLPVTWMAMRRRRSRSVPAGQVLLVAGLVLVWIALPLHALLGETAEVVATVAGSALLIAGHVRRLSCRACRTAPFDA